jgi:hypothetical protein
MGCLKLRVKKKYYNIRGNITGKQNMLYELAEERRRHTADMEYANSVPRSHRLRGVFHAERLIEALQTSQSGAYDLILRVWGLR